MPTTKTSPTDATFLYVDPTRVRPHRDNPRKDLGDLRELADSIREQGLLEPLLVEPMPDEDSQGDDPFFYQLVSGHRRLAAAVKAGIDQVPVIMYQSSSPLGAQLERMLTENLQRADLTPVEEGDAYQRMLALPGGDYTTAKIAKRLGRPRKHVTDAIKTAKLPESARERVLSGQLTIDDAAAIAQFASDPDTLARIERAADQGIGSLRTTLEYEKQRAAREKGKAKEERRLRKQGVTVIDSGDWPVDSIDLQDLYDDGADAAGDPAEFEKIIARHQDCPGHAAAVDYYAGRDEPVAVWLCTDPERFHPDLFTDNDGDLPRATTDSDAAHDDAARARREKEAAEQKARDRLDLQLRAAATVRRNHLGEILHQPEAADLAKTLMLEQLDRVLSRTGPFEDQVLDALAEVLLPNLSAQQRHAGGLLDRVRAALGRLTLAELVLVDDIRTGLHWDVPMEHAPRASWSPWTAPASSPAGKWRNRLEETYGYAWSPVEAEQIPHLDAQDQP